MQMSRWLARKGPGASKGRTTSRRICLYVCNGPRLLLFQKREKGRSGLAERTYTLCEGCILKHLQMQMRPKPMALGAYSSPPRSETVVAARCASNVSSIGQPRRSRIGRAC
jgi:hypothetical protein